MKLALHEVMLPRWRAAHPDAKAWKWETDPADATLDDRIRAELLARAWLRAL